jgi:hypothetical protein
MKQRKIPGARKYWKKIWRQHETFLLQDSEFMKNLTLFFSFMLLLSGCTTTVTYKANTVASPAKPAGYPIPVYTEDMNVPRPCEVIGTVSIHNSGLTIVGGSVEAVMKSVMSRAREKGADAVHVTSIEKPDMINPNYRMAADLLRYTDSWETIAIPENEFLGYLKQNERTLDPIEGIWSEVGQNQQQIGIMKNTSKPGRDFVAFILSTDCPSWHAGYKRVDLTHGKQRGTYNLTYYLDNFDRAGTTILLGNSPVFTLAIQTALGNEMIIYSKIR